MDRSSGKRGAGGPVTPRKAYRLTPFKDAVVDDDQNSQLCSRIGCSGRVKWTQNARIGNSDKGKCFKASFRSSNENEITGNSSGSSSITTGARRSYLDSKRKMPSPVNSDPSGSSLSSDLSGCQLESTSKSKEVKAGSSSVSLDVGPRKILHQRSGLRDQIPPPHSSVPPASRPSAVGPYNRSNGSSSRLRNQKLSSVLDVQTSCPQLESESAGNNMTKKRSSEGESSMSRRGRKITTPSSSIDRQHMPSTTGGISISDTMNINTRMRFSGRQNGRNSSSVREPAVSISQILDNERPFSIGDRSLRMPFTSADPGLNDVLHRFDMDRIAEVLLALERIEQDVELTHEQILSLETSLFLSGLNLYDQHRDMRLDIDNMSYEELLALEERMGSVSTALSEEAQSKCLRRSTYQESPSNEQILGSSSEDEDDTKCSICQEEYVKGDEIGKLVKCQHGYHATCINQWLQMKNWCPICKAEAEPSQSLPSV